MNLTSVVPRLSSLSSYLQSAICLHDVPRDDLTLNKGLSFVFIEQVSNSLYIKFDYILLVTETSDIKLSPVFLWT